MGETENVVKSFNNIDEKKRLKRKRINGKIKKSQKFLKLFVCVLNLQDKESLNYRTEKTTDKHIDFFKNDSDK